MSAPATAAELVVVFTRGFTGCVFTASLVGKLHRPQSLRNFVRAVQGLAPWLPSRPAAVGLLAGELLVVVLLLAGAVAAGLLLACALLAAFTAGIGRAVRARRRVACACFGSSTGPVGAVHLIRNAVLLVVALSGLAALPAAGAAAPLAPATVGVLVVAVVGAVCTVVVDRLADLFALTRKEN